MPNTSTSDQFVLDDNVLFSTAREEVPAGGTLDIFIDSNYVEINT